MRRLAVALLLLLLAAVVSSSFIVNSGAARARLRNPAAQLEQTTPDKIQRVTVSSPLHARAFLAEGIRRAHAGEAASALPLVEHAVFLNPRLADARLWLARHHLQDGRPEPAIEQLTAILVVSNELDAEVTTVFALAAQQPQARRLISDRLANTPEILAVLRAAEQAGLQPPQLIELVGQTNLQVLPNGVEDVQQILTRRLLEQGDVRSAYKYWIRLLPRGQNEDPVYDGNFAGLLGTPPFTWSFKPEGSLSVEPISLNHPRHRTALKLSTTSSVPLLAAEQTLVLVPGSYRLSAAVRTETTDQSSDFSWEIRCRDKLLAELPIANTGGRWAERSWTFAVPSGCDSQTLQIRTAPVDTGDEHSAQITRVSVQPL